MKSGSHRNGRGLNGAKHRKDRRRIAEVERKIKGSMTHIAAYRSRSWPRAFIVRSEMYGRVGTVCQVSPSRNYYMDRYIERSQAQ